MGMYDSFRETQVKCFLYPCNILHRKSEKLNDVELEFYCSSGKLSGFDIGDKVPCETPVYSFGKTFAIIEFSQIDIKDSPPQVIIIRNGKFYAKKHYLKITDNDIKDINLFIDRYGNPLKIYTASDICNCITDINKSYEKFISLNDMYEKEMRCEKVFSAEYRNRVFNGEITTEKMKEDFAKIESAREKADNESRKPIRAKYYIEDKNDKRIRDIYGGEEFGFAYYQLNQESFHLWEKLKLMQLLKEKYAENYEEKLEEYIKWIKRRKIKIKEKDIRETFVKYDKEITEEIEKEYLKSQNYEDATFVFKKRNETKS